MEQRTNIVNFSLSNQS